MQRILVTGGSGFVGRELVAQLLRDGRSVRLASRRPLAPPPGVEAITVGDIGPGTDWTRALEGVDAVVHLAARVHVGRESPQDWPLFHAVNAAGAGALARAAREAGVRKFILVSTTTVYGDRSHGKPFDESSPTAPVTAYARSKLEGERLVSEALRASACVLVILRPPLVYGPEAKGNFARLVSLVQSGVPLPFASVRNRRTLVFVGNLVDAVTRVLERAPAAGEYVVADREDVSTPGLVTLIAHALGRPPRLIPCPPAILLSVAKVFGRRDEAARLLFDMALDTSRIRKELDWQAPFRIHEAIARSVRHSHV